jgi:hypothetical protein
MTAYSKYTTTVVGSYSVPRWYETLGKQVESGILSNIDSIFWPAEYRSQVTWPQIREACI